ncbi:MAG TPA: flagellar basal body rod protein FlgB [Candidatus Competibacter sp.]|nr:flagellar basal body rod protein FlgB [Candidatus Competibacteraceae bacterium]MBK8895772.1 flagellar basal body rod protein FlgB [Candidatus Competibacteraceae bacterium]HCK82084.1 flagellar basal body rod protein FlgB [Candidatus Competibacteraceae bacterium]HRC73121.1 flagellar basal body rod protein FlgB [Candidatus Competibacter sp.]
MAIGFERALSVHSQALEVRSRRAEILAANLANADTPNYQARDLDFKATLAGLQGRQGALEVTHAAHLQAKGGAPGAPLYRTPAQMAIDGNTVEEEQEKAAFADNALRYQASLQFMGNRVQGLLAAIRGE